jgi:hypothetical protein
MATKRDFVINYGLQTDKTGATSNTLVVDSINDRVGIGTGALSIQDKLDVVGNATASTLSVGRRSIAVSYNCISETESGVMGIYGHNARSSTSVNNQVIANNNAWHGHFMRMYYNHGIAFHTTSTTVSSGNILYDQVTPANQVASAGERLRIAPSGNIGVNSTAPNYTLDVNGDVRVTSTNKMRFGGTSGTTNFYIQYNSTANSLDFVAG